MSLRAAVIRRVVAGCAVAILGCAPVGNSSVGWKLLFDGRSLAGWQGYRTNSAPAGWHASNGVLSKDGRVVDLSTVEQFGDFELGFDWKLSAGGNSGAFYRGTEEYDYVFWSAPEYQLLDDARHPDGKSPLTSAGAAFGLYPSPPGIVKPADEWNSSLIIARGTHVEHWLNGQKLLEYEIGAADWDVKVKSGKFAPYPNFGRAPRGHITFQGDHEGTLSLRNIRVKELK